MAGGKEAIRSKEGTQMAETIPPRLSRPLGSPDDGDAEEDGIRRASPGTSASSEGKGNDNLGQVQYELLHRSPQEQPYEQHSHVHTGECRERGCALVPIKDIGNGQPGTGCNGRDKGQEGEEHVDNGEESRRKLHQDDEDGDGIVDRA